ncbi:MAG: hypothetical protein ACOYT8_02660 [Candidatus Dependentiae bacterium]
MRYAQPNYSGILYLLLGIFLIAWSSAILLRIAAFICGLFLINSGLSLLGYRSLTSYASPLFMRGFRGF